MSTAALMYTQQWRKKKKQQQWEMGDDTWTLFSANTKYRTLVVGSGYFSQKDVIFPFWNPFHFRTQNLKSHSTTVFVCQAVSQVEYLVEFLKSPKTNFLIKNYYCRCIVWHILLISIPLKEYWILNFLFVLLFINMSLGRFVNNSNCTCYVLLRVGPPNTAYPHVHLFLK